MEKVGTRCEMPTQGAGKDDCFHSFLVQPEYVGIYVPDDVTYF